MREKRAARKTQAKLAKLDATRREATAPLNDLQRALEEQTQRLIEANQPRPPSDTANITSEREDVPLPQPPTWKEGSYQPHATNLSESELKYLTINKLVPTAIADAGATSNCGIDYESECGNFKMGDPFVFTGRNSNKIFQYANGNLAGASQIKELPMEVRDPAKDVHIVRGIKSNLISTGKFIDANYAWVFDNDEVGIYDKTNTKIITTRAAVLKGWRSPHDNLWHIPLVKPGKSVAEGTEDIIAVAQSPQEILRSQPVGAPEELYNVYELKTKPELV